MAQWDVSQGPGCAGRRLEQGLREEGARFFHLAMAASGSAQVHQATSHCACLKLRDKMCMDFRATAKKPPRRGDLLFVKTSVFTSASPRTGFKTTDFIF